MVSPRQPTELLTPSPAAAPQLLHEFFAAAAQQWPERVALEVPPGLGRPARQTFTYAELAQRSHAIAAFLQSFVAGECVVALLLPRCNEHLYVCQLAALQAGGAYTCLDPSFPDEQISDILADALNAQRAVLLAANRQRAEQFQFQSRISGGFIPIEVPPF